MNRPKSPKINKRILICALVAASLFAAFISAQAGMTNGGEEKFREDAGGAVFLPLINNSGRSFFLSPTGNDNHSGTSADRAWATFGRAWSQLQPGDTLILLDGVYNQSIRPSIVGKSGSPITIRAKNDGQAIIDGQGERVPVYLQQWRDTYFVFEGIVARNSSESVFHVQDGHNVFRRVSGYDANTDGNNHIFDIRSNYNLLEDCVASGTGRKMILLVDGEYNTIRRCLADWRQWDGRDRHECWPWGENIEIYNADNNIIENSIANGNTAKSSFSLLSQGAGGSSSGNKILGTMSIRGGMQADGTPMVWGDTRPQPAESTCVANIYDWAGYMSGFGVYLSQGKARDNLLQDIFSWGNARYGLSVFLGGRPNDYGNNQVIRATIYNNGFNNPSSIWGGNGVNTRDSDLAFFDSIQNSYIDNIWTGGSTLITREGEGARLTNRYVNGVLTNEPLWPWPMEDRIQAELGYSVTKLMTDIISGSP